MSESWYSGSLRWAICRERVRPGKSGEMAMVSSCETVGLEDLGDGRLGRRETEAGRSTALLYHAGET